MPGKGNHLSPAVVYQITNNHNGKFYIGATARKLSYRLSEHISSAMRKKVNGAFQRAIRKYGGECFEIKPIEEFTTLGEAKIGEIRLIALLKPHYNSTKGGDGQLGREFSIETRRKIGAASKGRDNNRRGKSHTETAKQRLREAGRSPTNVARLIRLHSSKALRKPVICLDTSVVYESASAAAAVHKIPKSAIIEVCLRKPLRVTAAGLVFRYVGDYIDTATELASVEMRKKERIEKASRRHAKKVRCISDGRVFTSTQTAGAAYGLLPAQIAAVANGSRTHVHGMVFHYIVEEPTDGMAIYRQS